MHASDAKHKLKHKLNLNLKLKHNVHHLHPSAFWCGKLRNVLWQKDFGEQVFDVPFSEPPAVLWMGGSIEQRFVLPSLGCCFWWGIEQTFVPFSDMHRPGGIQQTFALPKICSAGNVHRTDVLSNRCSAPPHPTPPCTAHRTSVRHGQQKKEAEPLFGFLVTRNGPGLFKNKCTMFLSSCRGSDGRSGGR